MSRPLLSLGGGASSAAASLLPIQPNYLPSDIPGCLFELDANYAGGLTVAGLSGVTSLGNTLPPSAPAALTDQGVVSRRPTLIQNVPAYNGKNAIRFDGSVSPQALSSNSAQFKISAQPYTIVFIYALNKYVQNARFFDEFAGSGNQLICNSRGGDPVQYQSQICLFDATRGQFGCFATSGESATVAGQYGQGPPHIAILEFNGTSSTISIDGGPATTTTNNLNLSFLASGLCLGAAGGITNGGQFDFLRMAGYGALLTADQKNGLVNGAILTYGVKRRPWTKLMIVQGDSIPAGPSSSQNPAVQSWPSRLSVGILGTASAFQIQRNIATGGNSINAPNTPPANLDDTYPDQSFDEIVYILALGSNDIANGRTDAQVIADMKSWLSARRAAMVSAGAQKIVIAASTIIARGAFSGGQDTFRINVNADLRANLSLYSADVLLDFAADARFGPIAAASNTTWYVSDTIHLNPAGEEAIALLASAGLAGKI